MIPRERHAACTMNGEHRRSEHRAKTALDAPKRSRRERTVGERKQGEEIEREMGEREEGEKRAFGVSLVGGGIEENRVSLRRRDGAPRGPIARATGGRERDELNAAKRWFRKKRDSRMQRAAFPRKLAPPTLARKDLLPH